MQVYLTSLGCRLNEAELQTWAQEFNQAGCKIASKAQDAQLIVMNSCAVTQEAVRKSRLSVRKLKKLNPQAKLIISGCYASLNAEEAANLLEVDKVVLNSEKQQLCATGLELLAEHAASLSIESNTPNSAVETDHTIFQLGRQRAFIKVQDGCRYRCTFCIVTIARGDEVSRPIQAVIDEINLLSQQNVKEIVLTGVHLGGYGHDIQTSLPVLIQQILTHTNIERIRMGSLEPWELNEQFFTLFENPRMMPHLHLPMQSGSDAVLQRMARRCKTADFARLIEAARATINNLRITSDIITGFPGESDSEWQQTLDFVRQLGFADLHIFPYSPREGTRAASLPNQINPAIRKQRAKQLAELGKTLKGAAMQKQLHQQSNILWESRKTLKSQSQQLLFGYTPNFTRVATAAPELSSNQISTVNLTSIADNQQFMWATPV
jgi:threonylcarbamoyladenosine tRNA methylthiotransferase MtaB